jgi:hypothetical protein
LQVLHPLDSSLPCSDSLIEFQPKVDLDFSLNMFKLVFIHLVHLLTRRHLKHNIQAPLRFIWPKWLKVMVHGIWAILNVHLDWEVFQVNIANAFNIVSCKVIF